MAFNKVFVALLLLIMLIAPAMATARAVLKASDAFQSGINLSYFTFRIIYQKKFTCANRFVIRIKKLLATITILTSTPTLLLPLQSEHFSYATGH